MALGKAISAYLVRNQARTLAKQGLRAVRKRGIITRKEARQMYKSSHTKRFVGDVDRAHRRYYDRSIAAGKDPLKRVKAHNQFASEFARASRGLDRNLSPAQLRALKTAQRASVQARKARAQGRN